MTAKVPIRTVFDAEGNATGLAEFQTGEFIDYTHGGTGVTSLGTAGQILKVNSGATALEFGNVEAIVNIDGATDLTGSTLEAADQILASDNGTEGRVTLGQLDTLFSGTSKTLTNKTINLTSNTLSGTTAQFNTALSDGSFATLAGSEILTNKTIDASSNTLSNIGNSSLTNSSITVTDGSTSTATSLGGTITFNGTANEVEVGESSGTITIGLPNDVTIGNNLTVTGDLTVNGTTTTVNSTTLTVDDKNIELGSTASPTDTSADGGGITLKGTTDKTFNWVDSTDSWTSSEHLDLASGKEFKINSSTVLTSSQVLGKSLPSGDVVGSSDTQTLTNKTIDTASNTITVVEADISDLQSYILADSTDTLTNKTFDANGTGNSISNIEVADFATGVVDTDLSSVSASDDTLASAKAIKAYVDSQVTAQDLDFQADTGGALAIDLDSETLTFTGGTGIDTSGSGNTVTFAIDSTVTTNSGTQTLTNKTLTSPVISTISNTGTLTLPTSTDTLVGRATTDTLTNKTINSASNTITITESNISDLGAYITASSTDTLTNKSISLSTNTVSGTLAEFNTAVSDATLVSTTGTETLTNKTITGTFTGNITGDVTGNADTATTLETARTIGGVSFDGSANINLPGVNTTGNQDTSGNAATATALETARTIAGQSFDGTANITIAATDLSDTDQSLSTTDNVTFNDLTVSGNLTVSGTTTTVNTETINLADNTITLNSNETGTPSQDGGIEIERGTSANKTLVWNETTDKWTVGSETFVAGTFEGNLTGDVTGNADTATTLQTARTIGGVSFNGSANINLPGVNTTGNQDTSGNAATATALATGRTIGLSGDVTATGVSFDGTGNITLSTTIAANSVALGTDTTGNYVSSLVAGNLIDLQNNSGESATPTIDVDLSELTTSTADGDGDFFVVVDSANAQKKLTKGNINISGFNNDSGFTTNTGTVTSVGVTAGTGLSGGGTVTSSGSISLAVDLSELTDMTATMVGTDEFVVLDAGADRRKAANEIGLSIFNNDAGFITSGGTDWQAVKTSNFTAVAGEGYFVNTTSSAITVTLPASPTQGDEVSIIDYAGTADTNNITVGRNSENIQGTAADLTVSIERAAFTLVYADSTQGWLLKDK